MGAPDPPRRFALLLLVGLTALACRRAREPAPPERPLEVAFAGCGEVLAGPICELDAGTTLTLWTPADPEAALTVSLDGRAVDAAWSPVEGGRRARIEVPRPEGVLEVRAGGLGGAARFTLHLQSSTRPPELVEVLRLRTATPTRAQALLDGFDPRGDPRLESEVLTLRAKLAFDRGDFSEMVARRRAAARLAAAVGLLDKPFRDLGPVAYVSMTKDRDATEARAALDAMAALPRTDYGAALLTYYEALWALLTGDPRGAARRYADAERSARRLGLDSILTFSAYQRAALLTSAGLHGAALEVFEGLEPALGTCERAVWHNNRAWAGIMAREVGWNIDFDPRADMAAAIEQRPSDCGSVLVLPNLLTTTALAALQADDLPGAEAAIEAAWRAHAELRPDVVPWLHIAEAGVALARGRAKDALAAYARLDAFSERNGLFSGRWRAAVGRAEVYEASGALAMAESAYAVAEARLDEEGSSALFASRLAPLPYARIRAARRFAALRLAHDARGAIAILERQVARHVRGLARAARVGALAPAEREAWDRAALRYAALRDRLDALEAARWGRATSLVGAAEAERRAAEAEARAAFDDALRALGPEAAVPERLPRVGPGRLRLGYHRLEQGWFGYALWDEGLEVARLEVPTATATPVALSRALLDPFRARIEANRELVVAARDELAQVDFHALPFGAGALVDGHVVTYALGTPAPSTPPATPRGALVVGDPDGSLPWARDEAALVARRLAEVEVPAARLDGHAVTRRALADAAPAWLWHWAGHGRTVERGLDDVGVSILPLTDGARFTVSDVLALPRPPAAAVLAACETAPPNAQDLDMARAFLLAGAGMVVAASRPVADEDAFHLARAMYPVDGPRALPDALRAAQLRLRAEGRDWAAFRALEP